MAMVGQCKAFGCLVLEIGVSARNVALQAMRLEASTLPHSLHSHVTDPQPSTHLPSGPVGSGLGWRLLREGKDLCLELGRYSVATARTLSIVESGNAFRLESFPPAGDAGGAQLETIRDYRV